MTSIYGPGDCFGERALFQEDPRMVTMEALERCELLCLNLSRLREVLGDDLSPLLLQRNFLLNGLKKSPVFSQFSSSQQFQIVREMQLNDLPTGEVIKEEPRFLLVLDGLMEKQQGADRPTKL